MTDETQLTPAPLARGDAFVLSDANGFGVALSINPLSGFALCQLQNGCMFHLSLDGLSLARARSEQYLVPSGPLAQADGDAS
jgi:hypothetical protein